MIYNNTSTADPTTNHSYEMTTNTMCYPPDPTIDQKIELLKVLTNALNGGSFMSNGCKVILEDKIKKIIETL